MKRETLAEVLGSLVFLTLLSALLFLFLSL